MFELRHWKICLMFCRGGPRISGKVVHMDKGVGFALLISLNPMRLRPNYFMFIGYLKTGVNPPEPTLEAPLF